MTQEAANALAALLGGNAWNSGGDVYLVTVQNSRGQFVAFSDEMIGVYPTFESVGDADAIINAIDLA